MSQVFSGDSVNFAGPTNIPTTTETPVVTGNFLNPPFGNAKAIITGMVWLTTGTGATYVTMRIRRNPNGENVQVATAPPFTVAAGVQTTFQMIVADVIPDGRPVQYQLTVQQPGATGNGTVTFGNISAILISG